MFELIVEVANAVSAVFWNLSNNNKVHAKTVVANDMIDAITNFQHGRVEHEFIFNLSKKNICVLKIQLFFFNNLFFAISTASNGKSLSTS